MNQLSKVLTWLALALVLGAFAALSMGAGGLSSPATMLFFVLAGFAMYGTFKGIDHDSRHELGDIIVNLVIAFAAALIFGVLPGLIPMPWVVAVALMYFVCAAGLLGVAGYGVLRGMRSAKTE